MKHYNLQCLGFFCLCKQNINVYHIETENCTIALVQQVYIIIYICFHITTFFSIFLYQQFVYLSDIH